MLSILINLQRQLLEWITIMQLAVTTNTTTYAQVHDALHLEVVSYDKIMILTDSVTHKKSVLL